MKVLQEGHETKEWSAKVECTGAGNSENGCGALLEVSKKDLYQTMALSESGREVFATFTCPQCHEETDVEGMPVEVIDELPHKEDCGCGDGCVGCGACDDDSQEVGDTPEPEIGSWKPARVVNAFDVMKGKLKTNTATRLEGFDPEAEDYASICEDIQKELDEDIAKLEWTKELFLKELCSEDTE